eukprot:3040569-Pleurochrysis_carterae.AAC.1
MIDAAGIVMQGVVFDVAVDAAEEGRRSHVGDRGYDRPQTDHQVRGPDATKRLRAMKLFKASKRQRGEVTALLLPPAIATNCIRSDQTCNY